MMGQLVRKKLADPGWELVDVQQMPPDQKRLVSGRGWLRLVSVVPVLLACAAGSGVVEIANAYEASAVGSYTAKDLRSAVFNAVKTVRSSIIGKLLQVVVGGLPIHVAKAQASARLNYQGALIGQVVAANLQQRKPTHSMLNRYVQ